MLGLDFGLGSPTLRCLAVVVVGLFVLLVVVLRS